MIIVSNHDVVQHSTHPSCPALPCFSLSLTLALTVANTDNVVDDSSSKTVICHSLRHSHSRSQKRSQRHDAQSPFCFTNYIAVCV